MRLGCEPGAGSGKISDLAAVMGDVARHVVVLLVDVAVEHHDVLVGHQELDRLGAVGASSSPNRGCRSNSGRCVSTTMRSSALRCFEVGGEPGELLVAQLGGRIGDVVEGDEVHALVVERVVGGAEELLEGLALVERGVVLARHEAHVLDAERRDDLAEALHALRAAPWRSSVVWVRSPVKTMKSGCLARPFTVATAFSSVCSASGLAAPL